MKFQINDIFICSGTDGVPVVYPVLSNPKHLFFFSHDLMRYWLSGGPVLSFQTRFGAIAGTHMQPQPRLNYRRARAVESCTFKWVGSTLSNGFSVVFEGFVGLLIS